MVIKINKPTTLKGWIKEIAKAYQDAAEAIPFGAMTGDNITTENLFHLAPIVCIKFRGLKRTRKLLKKATDAALSTFVATNDIPGNIMGNSVMSFALCYIASHYGLEIIEEKEAEKIVGFIEKNQNDLERLALSENKN